MFVDAGFVATVNTPYSGAYTTLRYGVPEKHSHVIQIEIARSLYWDVNNYSVSLNGSNISQSFSLLFYDEEKRESEKIKEILEQME